MKYGAGYNLSMLEQAAAFISVNEGDGSVEVHHGGVEMGQGLRTQVQQVAASVLNLPMELISLRSPSTSVIPNPSTTGASSGTTLTAQAVKQCCAQLRARLMDFGYEMLSQHGPKWCTDRGVDFWNYGSVGWAAKPEDATEIDSGMHRLKEQLIWQNLVKLAYRNRINLLSSATAKAEASTVACTLQNV